MKFLVLFLFWLLIQTNLFSQNNNYQYDNLNRLIKTTYPNSTVVDYSYDQLGNRTIKTITSTVLQQSDLLVQNQSLSQSTVSVGASVVVNFQVSNIGVGSAGANYVKCYLSANQTYEQGTDVEIGSQYSVGIAAASNSSLSLNVTIPSSTNPGSWYILILVDATNIISETNETNNLASLPISLINCSQMTASVSTTNSTCGLSNGAIVLTISGGNSPYTYVWSNGQTTQSLSNLSGGTYLVSITDFYGCTQTTTATVNVISTPSLTFSSNAATCGVSNGTASVSVSGGTAPYTYLWNTNQTSFTINNLNSGNYSVTVTDATNCMVNGSTTITSPSNLQLSLIPTQPACGVSNGSISSQVSGGTQPYTYLWSNSATTSSISGLSQGTYTLIVTDANNCVFTSSTVLSSINIMSVTTSASSTKCGNSNGTATVNVSNGTPTYQYLWSNSQTTQTATNLSAGVYNVTVTDANGCSAISYATVGAIQPPTVVCTSTSTSCTSNTGTASASVSFGTSPYTYHWNNNQNTQSISNLGVGTYSVTITDNNGCTANSSTTLNYNSNGSGNSYPTNGLVAYYPFTGNANDQSGNGNNGTVNGATLTTDRFNNPNSAYNFAGISNPQTISIPNSTSLQFSNAATFSVWIKMNSYQGMDGYGQNTTNGYHIVFAKDYDQCCLTTGIQGQPNGEFTSHIGTGSSGNSTWDTVSGSTINQWVNMTYVVTTSNISIYANGNLISSQNGAMSFVNSNTKDLWFGRLSSYWYPFNGKMDDIRIYNRALSLSEIQQIYVGQSTANLAVNIGNDTIICANQSITLNAGTGLNSYLWSNGSNSQSITLSNLNPGQHQYFVEVSACGSTAKDTINLTVNPQPSVAGAISGLNSFCSGQSNVQYSIPVITNATSYVWTLPFGATGSSNTNSISLNYSSNAVSGNISVKGHNTCGDGAASNLSITIQPIPAIAGLINTISGDTVLKGETNVIYKTPTIPDATTYFWNYSGTGATINGNGDSISVDFSLNATSGDLYVRGHNNCGDGLSSTAFPIVVFGTIGIDNAIKDDNIQIFPNPTDGKLTIQRNSNESANIEIFEATGKLIFKQTYNSKNTELDLGNFAPGVYLIKIKTYEKVLVERIVKQ